MFYVSYIYLFRDVPDSVGYEDGNMYALDDENKPEWVDQQIEEVPKFF